MDNNQQFINVLEQLEKFMYQKGETFRARAYSKAKEALILHKGSIVNKEDLAGIRGIGKTIIAKFQEFKETGTLQALEKEKKNPMFVFTALSTQTSSALNKKSLPLLYIKRSSCLRAKLFLGLPPQS